MFQLNKYSFHVIWSEEDQEYVGLCAEFPSLSWLAPDKDEALRGIHQVVSDTLNDLKSELGVVLPKDQEIYHD